ncbi:helix-turn-helix domain-containing protein [Bombella sp. ESL0387]|nr:helix-turn-helix domain-containing protein [Bombella sp. ESL0387]
MPQDRLAALQAAVSRHCPEKVTHTAFDFLTLYRTGTVTDPVLVVYEPRIYIVVQGQKILHLHDQPLPYGEGEYLISTLDLPVSGQITRASAERPYLALCISFSSTEMEQLLRESQSAKLALRKENSSPISAMGVSRITDDLLDALLRLVGLLARNSDQKFLAQLYKKELLYLFLHGQQGHVLQETAHLQSDLSRINRAIIHLRHHFQERFEIGTLVKIAGMGQSSFYKRFGELTGMTPVQYRTKLRLQEARRLMVHEEMSAASAGFQVGYDSPSQFSREYRKTFGRPPQADLQHIRRMGVDAYTAQHGDVWF